MKGGCAGWKKTGGCIRVMRKLQKCNPASKKTLSMNDNAKKKMGGRKKNNCAPFFSIFRYSSAGKEVAPTFIPSPAWFQTSSECHSPVSYTYFSCYTSTVVFLHFLHQLVTHKKMHFDCLISIFIYQNIKFKDYKCLFGREGKCRCMGVVTLGGERPMLNQ